MSELDSEVVVNITVQSSALSLPGFGRPIIFATTVPVAFSERIRYYTSAADMLADGFASSNQAYLDAVALMSQSPRPVDFIVARRSTPVAQVVTLTFTAVNATAYAITIHDTLDPETFSITSDGSATATEIATALAAAVNASTYLRVTAAVVGSTCTLTADNAGIPFVVTESSVNITQAATTPNTGLPEDVTAVLAVEDDWYGVLLDSRDAPSIMAMAAVVESMNRIFVAQSNDAEILSVAYSESLTPTSDVATRLKIAGYVRTALCYHPTDAACLAAAIVGRCLPPIPGSITWKFRQLAGVTTTVFTATQLVNLKAKSANGFRTVGRKGIFFEGTMASGRFIDLTHGLDKLYSRIQELFFGALLKADKVPMTQKGLDALGTNISAALEESVRANFLAASRTLADGTIETPAYSVIPPKVADIPDADREARIIPASAPFVFEARFAGAVHKGNVAGTLSF